MRTVVEEQVAFLLESDLEMSGHMDDGRWRTESREWIIWLSTCIGLRIPVPKRNATLQSLSIFDQLPPSRPRVVVSWSSSRYSERKPCKESLNRFLTRALVSELLFEHIHWSDRSYLVETYSESYLIFPRCRESQR